MLVWLVTTLAGMFARWPARASDGTPHPRPALRAAVTVCVTIAISLASIAPAASESVGRTTSGGATAPGVAARDASGAIVFARDVSFPQCRGSLPGEYTADFAILGTNNGRSFTRNPCLERQLAWAKQLVMAPAFYANTGNPGPQRARTWPIGQQSPRVCSAADPNSIGCSYDYGWNAAWDSYTTATDAAQQLHRVDRANARHRAANVDWWLDVETMNSWQALDGPATFAAQLRDVATIEGEVDALRTVGVQQVGIYSTALQWEQITGGPNVTHGRFADLPVWLAGYGSRAAAIDGCAHHGFTGGPLRLTQYLGARRLRRRRALRVAPVLEPR